MGTGWTAQIVVPADGMPDDVEAGIIAVLDRIVAQMSHWEPASDLSRFNRSAPGSRVQLPPEFSRVLAAALRIAEASGGAFDPAMGALADLWGFGPGGPRDTVPAPGPIAETLRRSGRSAIEHDPLLLHARRMALAELDFSGIAKGYAVDAVAAHLRERGFVDFLVEIGGEFVGAGIQPDGQPWWVDVEPVPGKALPPLRIALHELAVATSGDSRRSFAADGVTYSHTLDPRTGRPIANGVASVTVLHAECMLADAWATALTVLGPEDGMALAEREGLAAHMVVRGRELLSSGLEAMLG